MGVSATLNNIVALILAAVAAVAYTKTRDAGAPTPPPFSRPLEHIPLVAIYYATFALTCAALLLRRQDKPPGGAAPTQ